MNSAATTRMQDRLHSLSRRSVGLLVALEVLLLISLRASSEMSMMQEFGSDPQMPIWIMFFVVEIGFWVFGAGIAAAVLFGLWNRRWGFLIGGILLFAWSVAICISTWEYQRAQRALADARDPSTSASRLQELLHFSGSQAGYELDNRIAANPNTPPEVLRKLYERRQLGTLMILARNPNTPEDVLQAMVRRDAKDQGIRESLKRRGYLTDSMRQEVDENEQPE